MFLTSFFTCSCNLFVDFFYFYEWINFHSLSDFRDTAKVAKDSTSYQSKYLLLLKFMKLLQEGLSVAEIKQDLFPLRNEMNETDINTTKLRIDISFGDLSHAETDIMHVRVVIYVYCIFCIFSILYMYIL